MTNTITNLFQNIIYKLHCQKVKKYHWGYAGDLCSLVSFYDQMNIFKFSAGQKTNGKLFIENITISSRNIKDCTLKYIDSEYCHFINCIFDKVIFEDFVFKNTSFQKCRFDHCSFKNITFSHVNFFDIKIENCEMIDCKMEKCNLQYAEIGKILLNRSSLNFSTLYKTDFFSIETKEASFEFNTMRFSRFSFSDFTSVPFTSCYINGTRFYECTLMNTDFRWTTWDSGCEIIGCKINGITLNYFSSLDDLKIKDSVCDFITLPVDTQAKYPQSSVLNQKEISEIINVDFKPTITIYYQNKISSNDFKIVENIISEIKSETANNIILIVSRIVNRSFIPHIVIGYIKWDYETNVNKLFLEKLNQSYGSKFIEPFETNVVIGSIEILKRTYTG